MKKSAYPKLVDHVFLLFLIGTDFEDKSSGQMRLVEAHEHVLVVHVFQHEQLKIIQFYSMK